MSAMGYAPFVDQNFGDLVSSEDLPAIIGARCDKINRRIDPNTA
jgi:hypothetical protein